MNWKHSNRLCIGFSIIYVVLGCPAVLAADTDCNRICLERYVDDYLNAVIDNAPERLPLSENVRFTEDGQRLQIGDGLWHTMKGKGHYRLFVTDVDAGQVAFIGTIHEDHRDPNNYSPSLIALRLKVRNGEITEIEQIVVRDPDNQGRAAKRVEALGRPHPVLLETVPPEERMSRKDLIEIADKYFAGMQKNDGKGDYPFTDDCNRIENGTQTTNMPTPQGQTRPDPATASGYSGQWGCREQFESGMLYFVTRIRDRRYVAVDQERGLVYAFAFFDHTGGETRNFVTPTGRKMTAGPVQPWTWQIAEIFKIENGKIRQIEAILQRSPYGMLSGWSSWEDGMSDRIQDVTMD